MSDSISKGSNPNDALSQDADRVIPRHTVDGKNAATGERATMIDALEPDAKGPATHARDPRREGGFNPNDARGGGGNGGEDGAAYTDTKPAEVASASHTLPGPSSTGRGQASKGHNPTQ